MTKKDISQDTQPASSESTGSSSTSDEPRAIGRDIQDAIQRQEAKDKAAMMEAAMMDAFDDDGIDADSASSNSQSTSGFGDSTFGAGEETSTSSDYHSTPTPVLASRETKQVFRSKILVFTVLLLSAAAVGTFTYYFLSQDELSDFETQVSTEKVA